METFGKMVEYCITYNIMATSISKQATLSFSQIEVYRETDK